MSRETDKPKPEKMGRGISFFLNDQELAKDLGLAVNAVLRVRTKLMLKTVILTAL